MGLLAAVVWGGVLSVGCEIEPDEPFESAEERSSPGFWVATEGCAMAHCSPSMSDQALVEYPAGELSVAWDAGGPGSIVGLGCSSNGSVAACSSATDTGALRVYESDGTLVWDSGGLLGSTAFTSAPLVGIGGDVIAADKDAIIRFDPGGGVRWEAELTGEGSPISPIPLSPELLFAASLGGPVTLVDSLTGAVLDSRTLTRAGKLGVYDTINTPGYDADTGRIYVLAERKVLGIGTGDGSLIALEVVTLPDGSRSLEEAWAYDFNGPSGASVTVLPSGIYFDGFDSRIFKPDPMAFSVRDDGDHPTLRWAEKLEGGSVQASFAVDPRGGLWTFGANDSHLVRLSEDDGEVIQQLDPGAIFLGPGQSVLPASALTIGLSAEGNPVLTLNFTGPGNPFVGGIDVVTEQAHHVFGLESVGRLSSLGQFPVMQTTEGPAIVFTTLTGGAIAVR